jgi:transcriptional regulator with XRE-family HTH domain
VITGEQIRTARELLGWTPYRLAPRAGISHTLLRKFEKGARTIDDVRAARLKVALEEAGIEFLTNGSGEGVRLIMGRRADLEHEDELVLRPSCRVHFQRVRCAWETPYARAENAALGWARVSGDQRPVAQRVHSRYSSATPGT